MKITLRAYAIFCAMFFGAGTQWASAQANEYLDVTQAPFNAKCNGSTDDSTAIQAALNSTDPIWGGVIYFPGGAGCYIGTGLIVTHPGTQLVGQSVPGISVNMGRGVSKIISANGITAITFQSASGPSGHLTRSFMMRNIHVYGTGTTGNGVVINNCEDFLMENVTISDYIGGVALTLDGKTDNAQYAQFFNLNIGDSMVGFQTQGTGPNGWNIFGGYWAGLGTTPRPGSIAMNILRGDTGHVFGTAIQGWETGAYIQSPTTESAIEMHGPRFEFNNINLHIAGAVRYFTLKGGLFDNSILVNTGKGSIGIQIDAPADKITLDPTFIYAAIKIQDTSGGGVRYPSLTTIPPF